MWQFFCSLDEVANKTNAKWQLIYNSRELFVGLVSPEEAKLNELQ